MTNKELNNIEEAFLLFLRQINRKKVIKVVYHKVQNSKGTFDISFIGYETKKGGLHGIHYNGQYHAFSFGTRSGDDAWRANLTEPQVRRIPDNLKDAFKDVVNSRKTIIIKKLKEIL